MIARYSTLLLAFCLITAAEGLVYSAAAQSRANAGGDWVMPRTPDGHPDLQGTWTNVTITPFQRSEEQESPTLTFEDVQERQDGEVARVKSRAQPSDPDRPAPRAGGSEASGSVGGYNNVYIDRGTRIAWGSRLFNAMSRLFSMRLAAFCQLEISLASANRP